MIEWVLGVGALVVLGEIFGDKKSPPSNQPKPLHPRRIKPQKICSSPRPNSTSDIDAILENLFETEDTHKPQLCERARTIRGLVNDRKIPFLVHFTQVENLPSILKHGLFSVARTEENDIEVISNDHLRLDGHPNGISLSIAFPNSKMFYKYRKMRTESNWVVLVVDPSVLWTHDCAFYSRNAADHRMRAIPPEKLNSAKALNELFSELDGLPSREEQKLKSHDTTDVQAEVLVFREIKPSDIKAIAFNSEVDKRRFSQYVNNLDVEVHRGNDGLFATRECFNLKYEQTKVQIDLSNDDEIPF